MVDFLIVYGTMFACIATLILQRELHLAKARKASPVSPIATSRKHIRVQWPIGDTIGAGKIVYYGENGRKATCRKVHTSADMIRLRAMAAANGYRLI